jgi:hypothetical protein
VKYERIIAGLVEYSKVFTEFRDRKEHLEIVLMDQWRRTIELAEWSYFR